MRPVTSSSQAAALPAPSAQHDGSGRPAICRCACRAPQAGHLKTKMDALVRTGAYFRSALCWSSTYSARGVPWGALRLHPSRGHLSILEASLLCTDSAAVHTPYACTGLPGHARWRTALTVIGRRGTCTSAWPWRRPLPSARKGLAALGGAQDHTALTMQPSSECRGHEMHAEVFTACCRANPCSDKAPNMQGIWKER